MLTRTDCDVCFINHARRVERVNQQAWQLPSSSARPSVAIRQRLGSALIALGARLAPVALHKPAVVGAGGLSAR